MSLNIIRKDSTHHNERTNNALPTFLIIHYTDTLDGAEPDGFFMATRPRADGARVSAHYMIDVDGTTTQYVDEARRAWHAGVSQWEGMPDLNTHSIGIELVNPGHSHDYKDFPDAQINALITLSQGILSRHNIQPHHVLAHSDIAPGRKVDPGEKFPWKKLADAGIGLWPQPIQSDFNEAASLIRDPVKMKRALADYGYDALLELDVLVTEFQRHFQPEAFEAPAPFAGMANDETATRLAALLRQKLAIQP